MLENQIESPSATESLLLENQLPQRIGISWSSTKLALSKENLAVARTETGRRHCRTEKGVEAFTGERFVWDQKSVVDTECYVSGA
jgi:hypothetical protein